MQRTDQELIVQSHGDPASARVICLEPVGGRPTDDSTVGLTMYWHILRRRWPLMAVLIVLGTVTGLTVCFVQAPVYQAHLSLEIDNPNESAMNVRIGDLQTEDATLSPEAYLPTQMKILQSRTLRQQVIEDVSSQNLQSSLQPKRNWPHLPLLLVAPKSSGEIKTLTRTVQVDIRGEDNTRIVEVLCDSPSPRVAAAFANTLARRYIDSNRQAHWEAVHGAHEFLMRELEDVRLKLQNSEDRLQAYGRASGLMFSADKNSVAQDKLQQIQIALSTAQADRIEKQSAYQITLSSAPDAVPQVLDNARLNDYESQLATLRRQLAELSSQFTPEYPKVQEVQAQIDELETTFQQERSDILTRIRNDYQEARLREQLLGAAYKAQAEVVSQETEKAINYGIIEREVNTNRELYDDLLQKAKEADVASDMGGSNVRIIDSAEVPQVPYKPNPLWNALIGSLSGLMAGLGFVLTREKLDDSIKAPGEVPCFLKLPELGVIPELNPVTKKVTSESLLLLTAPVHAPAAGTVELVTWQNKSSMAAESFRSVLTSILCSGETGRPPRLILITSATRGEGKTTVASNLGIALAEINQKVLLIDADMRKPRLNEVFNLPNAWGLSDLLREKGSLGDYPREALVQRSEVPHLHVLTSGPRTATITDLLFSSRMLELLQRLRSEFDTILIDTPPMLQISDARILGKLVDAAVLVFRAGATSREVAMNVKHRLIEDGIPVLGTVLNGWDVNSTSRYGYSGSYSVYEAS